MLKQSARAGVGICVLASLSAAQLVVPNGTRITTRLEQTLSSATAEENQPVQLTVTDSVKVNGVVVIPQGSPAMGKIVVAQGKRSMGRAGKLDFSIERVRAADGEYIPLRYTMNKKEGEGKGTSTGVITAGVAVLFWPAAPFVLLRKGKDVTLNRGMTFEVFTDQDHVLQGAAFPVAPGMVPPGSQPAPMNVPQQPPLQHAVQQPQSPPVQQPQAVPVQQAPPQPKVQFATEPPAPAPRTQSAATPELATLHITASLEGAEVEIDGSFVGSTPAKTRVAPGVHKITVRHGVLVWTRDLTVQPGASINVNAIFKQ